MSNVQRSRRLISGEALAHSMLKDNQHDHFHRSAIYLLSGCAAAWDRHRHFARSSCCWRKRGSSSSSASHHPDLNYLKAVNIVAPPRDPQLLFLLMAAYSNANLQGEGAEYFSSRLKEFDSHDSYSKSALSERHRIVARAARILRLVGAPDRLRKKNNLYVGTSQAANRRAVFRRELDWGYRSCRTPPPV